MRLLRPLLARGLTVMLVAGLVQGILPAAVYADQADDGIPGASIEVELSEKTEDAGPEPDPESTVEFVPEIVPGEGEDSGQAVLSEEEGAPGQEILFEEEGDPGQAVSTPAVNAGVSVCTITLDANGGAFENGETAVTTTRTVGETVYAYSFLINGSPTRAGKRFLGFGLSKSSGILPDSTGYVVPEGPLTLYAVWVDVCEITWDANGGGYFTGLLDETVESTTYVESLDAGETIYNTGFIHLHPYGDNTLTNWSLTPDGSSLLPANGYRLSAGTLHLYAVWDGDSIREPEQETCTLTFDTNGGSFAEGISFPPLVMETGTAFLPFLKLVDENAGNYVQEPVREGYLFQGWSESPAGGTLLDITEEYTIHRDTVFYAIWAEARTVTYDANGGSFEGKDPFRTEDYVRGSGVDPYAFAQPVKDGMVFEAWSYDPKGTSIVPEGGITLSADITLYAVYAGTWTVTFQAGEGTFDFLDSKVNPVPVKQGGTIDLTNVMEPSLEGYVFAGWSTSPDKSGRIDPADGKYSSYPVTGDITLYAVWEKEITITFDANGGTIRVGRNKLKSTNKGFAQGTLIDLYEEASVPVNGEAEFLGWSYAADSTELIPGGSGFLVSEDVTVYAVWKTESTSPGETQESGGAGGEQGTDPGPSDPDPVRTFTVTFDGNGGFYDKGRSSGTVSRTVKEGTVLDLNDFEPDYYDDWEDFGGWSLTKNGTPLSSRRYTVKADVTLYAVWTGNIREAEISLAKQKIAYTGKEIRPAVTVVYGKNDRKLVENTDYTVTYSNNIKAGTATVAITGKGRFTGSATRTFTITRIAQSLTLKAAASSVAVGKTTTLTAGGAKETAKYTYRSSNTSVATVNSAGRVEAKKVGTVKITASTAQTTNYNKGSVSVTIKVVPAATTRLNLSNLAAGIRLTWNKVPGANGYILYRNGTKIKTISSGSTTTYTDKNAVSNGTKYVFKVVAKASTGTSPLSRSVTIYRLSRLSITSLKNNASKKMNVRWGRNSKAGGYEIQYALKSSFSDAKPVIIKSNATVSRTISSLKKGKYYYVRVRAWKKVGSFTYYSTWSTAKKVRISK